MNLYIWSYDIDYGAGVVFAVAESEEGALQAIADGDGFSGTNHWTHWRGGRLANRAKSLGAPDRIIALGQPYAEWHEWQG